MADIPQPVAQIKLDGRTLSRGPIVHDYGSRVQWKIVRDGAVVATPEARSSESFTLADTAPGQYEVVLETWKHEGYQTKALGKYIEISNKVSFRV